MNNKKLREEWEKIAGQPAKGNLTSSFMALDEVADWWLDMLSQRTTTIIKALEKKKVDIENTVVISQHSKLMKAAAIEAFIKAIAIVKEQQ